jgi:hypothetical protein
MAYDRNIVTPNRMLQRAVKALSMVGRRPVRELPGELKKIAENGRPAELQFNEWRIKYLTKKDGRFCLHWYVVNGISEASAYFYTRDFQGKQGGVYWNKLARAIRI